MRTKDELDRIFYELKKIMEQYWSTDKPVLQQVKKALDIGLKVYRQKGWV